MRRLTFAGHPVHPMHSDFPIVLCGLAFPVEAAAWWRADAMLWTLAFWACTAGVAFAVPTAVAGLLDFLALASTGPASRTAIWHLSVMSLAVMCFATSVALRWGAVVPTENLRLAVLALDGTGAASLGLGGWLGGHLVFRYGIGVSGRDRPA